MEKMAFFEKARMFGKDELSWYVSPDATERCLLCGYWQPQ